MNQKNELITFKVDQALALEIAKLPNRSEFIRNAIMAALEGICPMCQGRGVLSPQQYEHWKAFSKDHSLAECCTCSAIHITCKSTRKKTVVEHGCG